MKMILDYNPKQQMNINTKVARLVSSWFFIGFAPAFPGTLGSIAAIPLCFYLTKIDGIVYFSVLIMISCLAIWSSSSTERSEQKKDPGEIVIDEVVGMIFSTFLLPFTKKTILCSLVLFRIIDILKPPPIRLIEKKIPGGLGIVCDDILAGIATNLIIRIFFVF